MADNTTTSAPPKKSIADFFRAPAALRTGAPKSIDVLSAVDLCESIAQTKDNALDSGASDSPTPVQPPQTISKVNTEEVAVAPAVLAPIIQLQQEHPIAQAPQLPQPTTTATPSVHPFFNIKARKEQLEKERLEKEMAEKVSELQTQQQESTEGNHIPAPPQQPQQKPKRKRASKKTTPQQPPDETAEEETVPTEVPETVNPPKQKRQRKKRVKAAEESKVVAIPDSTTVPVPVADELAAVQEQSQQAPTVPTESNLGERDTFLSQENNSSCSMPVEAFVEPVQNCPEPVQVAEPNLPLDVTTEEEIVLPTPPRVILKNPLQSTKVVHPFFNLAAQKEKILKKDVAVAESEEELEIPRKAQTLTKTWSPIL
ncbi:hypothetical protein BCR33DRAFT_740939 [Rhizoclosmatium globosum]|uniref:Uncharacterized protein n=1 Tax=Rhizoclosmatium globosum TaxID=329046 RepID=A0A1Y2BXY4_9FUNG|nr:hypothetical protein BCR33DRAFT_740939 [Rhizoclosmatium globosum]|eukprot:ORY39632.1 hypothetical protein BCR33DRAFT_740939 [Rhizoclosmatium globosum]